MEAFITLLITTVVYYFSPRHNAEIRLLKAQLEILQKRLEGTRVIPTPQERTELVRLGAILEHNVTDTLLIVKLGTYRRWLSQLKKGQEPQTSGRPPLSKELRNLVVRMAQENLLWGYRRITGELKKLGYYIGYSTTRRILQEHGIHPTPEKKKRKPPLPWSTFIAAEMESIMACDFCSKEIYSPTGKFTAYILIFIHLESRHVFCTASTKHPDSAWVHQQAKNAIMWCDAKGIKPKYLIRDADTKFTNFFNEIWHTEDVRVIQIPHKSPKANAFAESFIGSLKRETLDFFVCFSRSQLDYIVRTWVRFYNTERPHQGRGRDNNVLQVDFKAARDGPVKCRESLGGIIKSYYREAA